MRASVIMNTIGERRDWLDKAIQSYICQDCELLISTIEDDVNLEYIKDNYPKAKIIITEKNSHPYSKGIKTPKGSFIQLNNALSHITTKWFTFASGNDYAYLNKIDDEVLMCEKNKKLICYSAFDNLLNDGTKTTQLFHDYDYQKHLRGNFVSDCAMISKDIVDKFLPFRIELNNYAYWDLWIRVYKSMGDVFIYNPTPTWVYRQNNDSMHNGRSREQVMQEASDRSNFLKSIQ